MLLHRAHSMNQRRIGKALLVAIVLVVGAGGVGTAYAGSDSSGSVTAEQVSIVAAKHKNAHCQAGRKSASGTVVCFHTGQPPVMNRAAIKRSPKKYLPLPAHCVGTYNPADPGYAYGWPDRLTGCADVGWFIDEYRTNNGVEEHVGSLQFGENQWAQYSTVAGDPSWIHGIKVWVGPSWGTLTDQLVEVSSNCTIQVTECKTNTSLAPDPDEIDMTQDAYWENEWSESAVGLQATNATFLDGVIAVDFSFSFETIIDDGTVYEDEPQFGENIGPGYKGIHGRCDSVANGKRPGCVDDYYTPTVTFNAVTKSKVEPVASHIYSAQRSLPEHWGVPLHTAITATSTIAHPLHYDSNPADATANNTAACKLVKLKSGQSCDEYPMASTYQGAAFQPSFSAVAVPSGANSSQGGTLSSFYSSNRMLDGDAYWVQVILKTGPSWVYAPPA